MPAVIIELQVILLACTFSLNRKNRQLEEATMSETKRQGAATFKGKPLTLVGPQLKVGDKAPDFKLVANDLSEVSLSDFKGKTVVVSVVVSLDTPTCDLQTKRFNEEAGKHPGLAKILTISADLPFAQARWCGASHASQVQTLSDHRELAFGKSYGVLIDELRLLSRAIFVIGPDGKISYVEYLKEITEHPNYEKALAALSNSK
jgi:thiol peroxidase